MYCPRCRAEISDSAIVCPNCGEHFAVELQMIKCRQARNRSMQIIFEIFHSKLFLVFSIFLSILCGSSIISAISLSIPFDTADYGMNFDVVKILVFVFSLIGMIAAWKIYSSNQLPPQDQLKKLRFLPKTLKILQTISYIALIVLLAFGLIFLISSSGVIEYMESQDLDIMQEVSDVLLREGVITSEQLAELADVDIYSYIVPIMIVFCIIMALGVAVNIIFAIAYKKTAKYLQELENTLQTGKYEISSAPSKIMFVMGIICAAGGISVIVAPIDALYSLSLGGYMITLSLIMKNLHVAQIKNNQEILREEEKLAYLARCTNEYFANLNRQTQSQQYCDTTNQNTDITNQDPDITT